MSTFKKHVGRIKNTDRRCVVVYMQIPGNEEKALIVDTDALPDRFHDALMDIVDSNEGQQTPHLHTLLQRRILPDLGLDIMNALHMYGQLRPVEIDNVVMYPAPNAPCPLRTIVDYMTGTTKEAVDQDPRALDNRVLENQRNDATQAQIDIATNMLRQAQDLEDAATAKREQAYRMVPALRLTREATDSQVTPSPEVAHPAPEMPSEPQMTDMAAHAAANEGMTLAAPVEGPSYHISDSVDVSDLPDDVKLALHAAAADMQRAMTAEVVDSNEDVEGNQVDASDDAVSAFLDRAAHFADQADRELQESLRPKNPVGRPRKDGLPAGTKPEAIPPAPKKRGRPPKVAK